MKMRLLVKSICFKAVFLIFVFSLFFICGCGTPHYNAQKYFWYADQKVKKIRKETNPLVAAQFYQIEHYITDGVRFALLNNIEFIHKKK